MARTSSSRSPFHFLAAAFLFAAPLAVGCGAEAPVTGDEDDIVPADAATLFDQAGVCDAILKRHATVRDTDLKDGSIRWNCGDVAGVTSSDRGQEYCEYNAVSKGKLVTQIKDVAAGAPIQCLFTGVFKDTTGKVDALAKALADKANVGGTTDKRAVQMTKDFNARGAATALVDDCAANASKAPINEARQVACYQASVAIPAKAAQLKKLCRGKDLTSETTWKKVVALGAKVLVATDAGFDAQRDIAGCAAAGRSGGVTWRNSDNMICGRVTRAAAECSCAYNDIPTAVDGFTFTGWTNDALPTGCRYAKVAAADYKSLVICEISAGERDDLELNADYTGDLQSFCHDRFSTELVMKAPIRALEKPATCKPGSTFCSAYTAKAAGK